MAQLASDEVPHERTLPAREQIQRDLQESRFHLGPFRILPRLVIRDSGYDSNIFGSSENPVSDWTADVGLGARAILPAGRKIYFVAEAVPEYIWYARYSQRRTFGGLYRGSLLGFFNRMSVEVAGYDSKFPVILNSETETRVLQNLQDGSVRLEIDVTRTLSVFASGEVEHARFSLGGQQPPQSVSLDVERLDRTDTASRAGIRYKVTPHFNVTLAAEGTRTNFVLDPGARDNKSRAYLLGIHYDRPRFFVNLSGGYRKGGLCRCTGLFPSYETATGSYFVSIIPARSLEVQLYGHRDVPYSLFQQNPYYVETRNGGGPSVHIGRRVTLRAFGEYGTNAYAVPVEVESRPPVLRRDTATTYGGGLSISLFRNGVLTGLVSHTRYESNLPQFNRSVFRFTTGFSLEGEIPR